MTIIRISSKLPKNIINELLVCEGVVLRKGSLINVIEIVDSNEGQEVLRRFHTDNADVVDPLLNPGFGLPLRQYVSPTIQNEIFNIINTFQQLDAAQIANGGFDFVPAVAYISGFQYHHEKIVIQAVQEELQTVNLFSRYCPALAALPSGNVVCDLSINYANVVIATRIRKL